MTKRLYEESSTISTLYLKRLRSIIVGMRSNLWVAATCVSPEYLSSRLSKLVPQSSVNSE